MYAGKYGEQAQETDTKRASKVPWIVVKDTAARTAFVLNQWKTVAENSRSLGWTSSSEESMMKLRREAATADAMKLILPTLMQRAAIDKALQETGSAPADTPDNIKTLGICAAISVGAGSACALYHKSPDQSYYRIDHLVANTAVEGQLETQVSTQVVRLLPTLTLPPCGPIPGGLLTDGTAVLCCAGDRQGSQGKRRA